jgi:hypothetical protein
LLLLSEAIFSRPGFSIAGGGAFWNCIPQVFWMEAFSMASNSPLSRANSLAFWSFPFTKMPPARKPRSQLL